MKTIWVIVSTYHGLIQEPQFFYSKAKAEARLRRLRRKLNLDYDEVELFRKRVIAS
jgi:hypothetical protein